jgi:hypothetical protein
VSDSAAPIPLRYADRAEQYAVLLEEWPGGVRITIPPRFLKFLLPTIVIELDATRLHFEHLVNMWLEADPPDRPREAIYEIKFVKHSGNLFIRAHGHGIVEVRPHRDPKVVEWIAERLNAALGVSPV